MRAVVALLTDFGTHDSYVGVMKGVIASIAPDANIIDISHQVRAQDIAHGAYLLAIAAPYFPAGTTFCAVVDPGVGSRRRAVAVEAGQWRFVLPDNGLITRLLERWEAQHAVVLNDPRYHLASLSATFHGRDLFAPVAAHLASGVTLGALGEPLSVGELCLLDLPGTRREGDALVGTVMHVDHFGNLITTITGAALAGHEHWEVLAEALPVVIPRISRTFADVPSGNPVAYIGSDGYIELAIRDGNAAESWGLGVGESITVRPILTE